MQVLQAHICLVICGFINFINIEMPERLAVKYCWRSDCTACRQWHFDIIENQKCLSLSYRGKINHSSTNSFVPLQSWSVCVHKALHVLDIRHTRKRGRSNQSEGPQDFNVENPFYTKGKNTMGANQRKFTISGEVTHAGNI